MAVSSITRRSRTPKGLSLGVSNMPKISRRTALARGGRALTAAAILPLAGVSVEAHAAEGDAELLDLEAQVLRLIDGQNAGLCNNAQGDISEETLEHEDRLEAAIIRTAAHTPQGIAVKLRRQRYWLGDVMCDDTGLVDSALADLERLAGRA